MISHSAREWVRRCPRWRVLIWALFRCVITWTLLAEDTNQTEARLKFEEPRSLQGSIYARGSNQQKLLFRFRRQATRSDSMVKVLRDFSYPDGKAAAQEQVVYEGNHLLSFTLRELQTGAEGSVTIRRANGSPNAGTIEFQYTKSPGNPVKSHSESLRENTLVGDMIGPFLADHWQELMRGEKVKSRYVAVQRLETVGFTFVKEGRPDSGHPGTVSIKMEPTSRIIAAIVDPLYFTVEAAPPHRILFYNGRTTPKLNDRGKWEDLDAITVFDRK